MRAFLVIVATLSGLIAGMFGIGVIVLLFSGELSGEIFGGFIIPLIIAIAAMLGIRGIDTQNDNKFDRNRKLEEMGISSESMRKAEEILKNPDERKKVDALMQKILD